MAERESPRKIQLTFGGEAFSDGRVPLTLLARKLEALQNLLFHAAATVKHDTAARRGQWANRYRDAVELRFADSRPGSLVIEAELSPPVAPVLGNEFDFGLQALDLSYRVLESVSGEPKRIAEIVPDRQERALLLRSIESLSPDPAEEYYLELSNGTARHGPFRLSGKTRLMARYLVLRESMEAAGAEREATIVGTLTKIHYDVAPQKISVRIAAGREIDCYYDESLRDQVANLCAGSIVEVTGIASLDAEERVKQIDSVIGVETVSMEPVRIERFEHGGRVHKLREPVAFNVEFADGVWVYSNDALGVRGYGFKRDDALRELHEAFDFAFQDIALEDDRALTEDASRLKRRLLELVAADANRPGAR